MARISSVLIASIIAGTVMAGSLTDIKHVVLFMQENRAFDHYFGTMAGVRGFNDPNVQINSDGRSVYYQNVDASLSKDTTTLAPWYLNYLGGNFNQATQCMTAGSNGWTDNHAALNGDLNNMWALNNTPWSWGYFHRKDLPVHFSLAEEWTVGDMYQESVIASTDPNRVSWMSGSINAPGSPQSPSQGTYIDNNENPGCEKPNLNCFPLTWKTVPEYWQDANVTWQVWQDVDNFDDNALAWFDQFRKAAKTTSLYDRGMSFKGLDAFYAACKAGTLPDISIIVGPAELSEHPPYQPVDGAWLQRQVVTSLVNSPSYNNTALIISYDETGGWGDHVVPFHSPPGTAGEYLKDPYGDFGTVYTGPGFRLPFYIISPWTRGGHVYTEHADHISQIKFVEQWLAAKGKNVMTSQIPTWRRQNMADLTKAFDFSNPNYSLPKIPIVPTPSKNGDGDYNGYAVCEATYPTTKPPVPYKQQTPDVVLNFEEGFKSVRGQLTEGRYLTFEMNGFALTNSNGKLTSSKNTASHNGKSQRFVVHQTASGANTFTISSAVDGSYITGPMTISKTGTPKVFAINDLGNGKGYTLYSQGSSKYITISSAGALQQQKNTPTGFSLFSVTYKN